LGGHRPPRPGQTGVTSPPEPCSPGRREIRVAPPSSAAANSNSAFVSARDAVTKHHAPGGPPPNPASHPGHRTNRRTIRVLRVRLLGFGNVDRSPGARCCRRTGPVSVAAYKLPTIWTTGLRPPRRAPLADHRDRSVRSKNLLTQSAGLQKLEDRQGRSDCFHSRRRRSSPFGRGDGSIRRGPFSALSSPDC